ncbi:hypothetical protein BX667DRAFT_197185 [Coemansia mojavensis]|nr:hypothetical protein BX667DRAFT_197185 [Coemansia mojavensis]
MPPKTNLDTTRLSTIVEDYAAQGPITRSRAKQLAAAAIPQPDPTKEKRGITARLRPSARKADAVDAADMAATPPRSSLADAGSAFPINPAEAQLAVQMGQVAIDKCYSAFRVTRRLALRDCTIYANKIQRSRGFGACTEKNTLAKPHRSPEASNQIGA